MCVGDKEDIPRVAAFAIDILTVFFWAYLINALHTNKDKLLFVKRGPILLQAYVYVSCGHVVIFEPILIIINSTCVPEYIEAYISYICFGLFYVTLELSHTIFAFRFLLHYAKIQRSESIGKSDHEKDANMPFIVKYHNIFGNPSKVFIICSIITLLQLIVIIIITIAVGFPYNYQNATNVSSYIVRSLIPVWFARLFITFYCFIKSRKFEDYWLITQEFKYLITSLLIVTFVFFLAFCSVPILRAIFSLTFRTAVIVIAYINVVIFSFWSLATAYISVIWVNKMNDKLLQTKPKNDDIVTSNSHDQDTAVQIAANSNSRAVTIVDVLTDKQCMLRKKLDYLVIYLVFLVVSIKIRIGDLLCLFSCFFLVSGLYVCTTDVNTQRQHQTDYLKFFDHCQKEFCSENLLFVGLMVQWQYFLIKHNVWPRNVNGELDTGMQLMDSSRVVNTMNILPILDRLDKTVPIQVVATQDQQSDFDYSAFIPIIELIYKKYIEMDKAPFEVNISFEIRDRIRGHYDCMKNSNDYLNQQTFWQLWTDLLSVCAEVFEMIPATLMRCFKPDRVDVFPL